MDKMLIVDLQTKLSYDDVGGKKGMDKMGISVAGLFDYSTNKITFYDEEHIEAFIQELYSAKLIMGMNLTKFIYRVLAAFSENDFSKLKSLDVLEYFKKRLTFKPTLEGLFNGTLGIKKFDTNDNYVPMLFKQGRFDEIKSLCNQNIDDLKNLFDFGMTKGFVFYDDKAGQRWKISVNW